MLKDHYIVREYSGFKRTGQRLNNSAFAGRNVINMVGCRLALATGSDRDFRSPVGPGLRGRLPAREGGTGN